MDASHKNEKSLQEAYQTLKRTHAKLQEQYERSKEKEHALQIINEFAVSILSYNTVDEIVWALAKHPIAHLGLEDCVIYLLDESGTQLMQRAAHGPKNPQAYEILEPIVIPVGRGIVGSVAASGMAEMIADTRLDERYIVDDDIRLSELAVPILYQDQVIGVIDSEHHQLNFFTEAHKNILTTLASMASAKIVNAMTIEKLQSYEKELKQYRDHLEDLVALRTQELTERTTELSKTLFNLKVTQEQLVKAKEAAERANQAKSEFLSRMSHEFRTPLNGILGYAQLLKETPNLDRTDRQGVAIIYQSGHHLLTLVNDILDLAKIEARKMELDAQKLHLGSFLHGIAGIMRMRAEEANIGFRFEAEEGLPRSVLADEKRLRQVLLNLLGNAVKCTHQGQVALNVSLRDNGGEFGDSPISPAPSHRGGGDVTLRFEVADTGVGMTREQQSQIFLPFEQVGELGQRAKGTGLGLAITRQLVALMGGEINVKSQVGKGSTFWFDLTVPVVIAEMSRQQRINAPIRGYRGAKRKILVVDDQPENRLLLRLLLSPLGFEIEEAENGAVAIERCHDFDFDMILTDLMMPVMNGFEAVKEIRQFRPKLPIIAISASVFEHDRRRSQQAGCNAFLAKPISQPKLLSKIEQALNLTWIYEPSQDNKESTLALKQEEERLIVPPYLELAALYKLAILGNMRGIREWTSDLEQVESKYIPFAQKIRQLAINFEDEGILDLVEKYMTTQPIMASDEPKHASSPPP